MDNNQFLHGKVCKNEAWKQIKENLIATSHEATSTCRTCQRRIDCNAIRLGNMFQHREGFVLVEWHHIDCIACPKNFAVLKALENSNLSPEQREYVHKWTLQKAETTEPQQHSINAKPVAKKPSCDRRNSSRT